MKCGCGWCESEEEHQGAVTRAQQAVTVTQKKAALASEADAPYAQRQFELAVEALKRLQK